MEVRQFSPSSGTPPFWVRACGTLAVSLHFELFFKLHQNDSKNKAIGNSAHACCQKGGVPEEAEIGRAITPFQNESTEGKLKNNSKIIPIGDSAHARRQKGEVPEEAEIYLQLIYLKKV